MDESIVHEAYRGRGIALHKRCARGLHKLSASHLVCWHGPGKLLSLVAKSRQSDDVALEWRALKITACGLVRAVKKVTGYGYS